MQSSFMNVSNMRGVMEGLEARMGREHWDAVGNARVLVLNVMQDVDADADYVDMSVPDKNAAVADISWNIITDLVEKALVEAAPAAEGVLPPPPPARPPVREGFLDPVREGFLDSVPAVIKTSDDVKFGDTPDGQAEVVNAASPDYVDKLIKQPWAPPSKPPDTTIDISIDGFDRDIALFPTRYSFKYQCGNLRNVTNLKATNLSMPASTFVGTPYVLLVIEEFSALFNEGAGSAIRKSFCKFVLDKITGFEGARQFARLKPEGGGERDFAPPLPSLGLISVRFTFPDGGLISDAADDHDIANVLVDSDNASNWIVRTRRSWRTDFVAGDLVKFSGLATPSGAVNEYVCRSEGHIVKAVGDPVRALGADLYSNIIISGPKVVDAATGEITDDVDATLALLALNPVPVDVVAVKFSGSVLNISVQPSVSMRATCIPSVRHEAVI